MAKKKASKVRTVKIENDLYNYVLFVRVGGSRESAIGWFEKKFDLAPIERNEAFGTTMCPEGEISHAIWFADVPSGSIVAHEAFHSVCHVMDCVGMGPLGADNEEAWAYLLQWTVSEILRSEYVR